MIQVLLVLSACQNPDPVDPPADTNDTNETTVPPPGDTAVTEPPDSAGTDTYVPDSYVAPPLVDCAALPPGPLSVDPTGPPRGHHGLAFDDLGSIVGFNGNALVKWLYDGTASPWAPGISSTEQMDWLDDGDLAVALPATSGIIRVNPAGVTTLITSDVGAYGVTVGPDGKIWAGNNNDLVRIDPVTGAKEVLINGSGNLKPRVIDFSPDVTKVYVGTFASGQVYVADLDANYDIVSPPVIFANGVGNGPYMDCLTVDECGNLYVCDYSTNNLYKVTPVGDVSVFVDWSFDSYGHGVAWGSGVGGWSDTAIYLPQPYNSDTIVAVELGFRSGETLWPLPPP